MHENAVKSEDAAVDVAQVDLRPASRADVGALARMLADAFYEDPMFSFLMPNDASRLPRLRRFFASAMRDMALVRGRVWTSTDLLGAALTMPPGAWRVPPRATLLQGPCFGRHMVRAARVLGAIEYRHPREPHYYFIDIGVAPRVQGEGRGSTVMRPTLDRCDREGLPAYLEASSERSAALYERLGFRVTSELRVAGSPPLRLMFRPPHSLDATR
jgi:ribosomal protein S18 acetylase RimI-like enzyme